MLSYSCGGIIKMIVLFAYYYLLKYKSCFIVFRMKQLVYNNFLNVL